MKKEPQVSGVYILVEMDTMCNKKVNFIAYSNIVSPMKKTKESKDEQECETGAEVFKRNGHGGVEH